MRITRESVLKLVQDTVSQRARTDRTLLAVYLHGSLLEDEFLIGGAGDADLFIVHADVVDQQREIVPLSDDIHLDIAHSSYRDYRQTRLLRIDPWMGPTLKNCKILYDPQHLLDFTLASVGGQFERPDHVMERVRALADSARRNWIALHEAHREPGPSEVEMYLGALENAANAVLSLTGSPLTERRFLQRLPQRANAAGRPGLYAGVMGLLGASQTDRALINTWLTLWQSAYIALPGSAIPVGLHPGRLSYYLKACQAITAGDQPQHALWPLLRTWTRALAHLPESYQDDWQSCVGQLGLSGSAFAERVAALDAYLDMVEEALDQWAAANGAAE